MTVNVFIKRLMVAIIFLSFFTTVKAGKLGWNDNPVKENRKVSHFNEIDINGTMNIYLSQGNKESVVVETTEKLQPVVIIKVKNKVLYVKTENGFHIREPKKINVYITVKDLNKIQYDGVGNLKCLTEINVPKLDVYKDGVGNIFLNGSANNALFSNDGVGNIKAFNFIVKHLTIRNTGVGNMEIYASKTLSISKSGVGNIYYRGNAVITDIKSTGVGKIQKKEAVFVSD